MMKSFCLLLAITSTAFSQYKLPSSLAIEARVADAKAHLAQTEGGKLLWESIEAHGGLGTWFSNGLLTFRWAYHMKDMGENVVMDSTQTIDTWSSKAVHTLHSGDAALKFGWDGSRGWVSPEGGKMMIPASFWALTPYYFVGVPHVLADPGTIHQKLDERIRFQGEEFDQVKVTYDSGTGETPGDYYIVLIHPATKLVKAVRYIVTDQRITKGQVATPEKLLTYEDWYPLQGVLFPKKHYSYKMNGNEVGEKIRYADVSKAEFLGASEVSFSPEH